MQGSQDGGERPSSGTEGRGLSGGLGARRRGDGWSLRGSYREQYRLS